MQWTAQQVLEAAMSLSLDERLDLADALYSSLPAGPPTLHPEWQAVLDRRSDELLSGRVEGVPWEEVQRRARAILDE